MKKTGNSLALIAFASTLLLVPAGFAQQANQTPNQGVSNPPADDTIVTSQDEPANPSAATAPAPGWTSTRSAAERPQRKKRLAERPGIPAAAIFMKPPASDDFIIGV